MLFGRKKKEQEIENKIRELYALSIDELANQAKSIEHAGSHDYIIKCSYSQIFEKITGRKYSETNGIYNDYTLLKFIYFDKLVRSPEEQGGFGGNSLLDLDSFDSLRRWFFNNLTDWRDFYKSAGKYSGGCITNYGLEYIRICINKKFKTPLSGYWMEQLEGLWKLDDDELVLNPALIVDRNCFIYDSRIYDNGTYDEVFHKLKSCLYLYTQKKNGRVIKQFDGNHEPTGKVLTLEDLLNVSSADVPDFLSIYGYAD